MKPKILLVEDTEINIRVAKLHFERCDITNIVIARSGREALALFSNKYSLVLLDIGLPDMSGTLVCRQMRNVLEGKPMPIIAYTAFQDFSKKECIEAGLDDYLLKPVMFEDFKAMVEVFEVVVFKNTTLNS
jgi:CheY-like chemotaxis protein